MVFRFGVPTGAAVAVAAAVEARSLTRIPIPIREYQNERIWRMEREEGFLFHRCLPLRCRRWVLGAGLYPRHLHVESDDDDYDYAYNDDDDDNDEDDDSQI